MTLIYYNLILRDNIIQHIIPHIHTFDSVMFVRFKVTNFSLVVSVAMLTDVSCNNVDVILAVKTV